MLLHHRIPLLAGGLRAGPGIDFLLVRNPGVGMGPVLGADPTSVSAAMITSSAQPITKLRCLNFPMP